MNARFIANADGLVERNPAPAVPPLPPAPLAFKVGAWVEPKPGFHHSPGVVVEVVTLPGKSFVQVLANGDPNHPYLVTATELVVVRTAPC